VTHLKEEGRRKREEGRGKREKERGPLVRLKKPGFLAILTI